MSLSNAASNATLIQQNATLPEQKSQLPNPFELDDKQILHKVYMTHVNDDEKCDKDILFNLTSLIVLQSQSQILVTSFKPDFPALKRISCQMITTRGTAQCAHQTTIWILQQLRCFSWDAKALITLASFSLEYGEFWHLYRIPASDQLGNTLKQLNQVQNRKVPAEINELVMFLLEVFQLLKEWATWCAMGYETDEVQSLSEAMQEIPLVVYWTVATVVACTGNLVGISEHKLSDFKYRLSAAINDKFKDHLQKCKVEIGRIDDYRNRMKNSKNVKDIVDLLKLLIHGNGSQIPLLYEGGIQVNTGIEVFKQKHVLLFISSLDSNIRDEILLLNSIYDRLQENPKQDRKGYMKEDFKILWIPIVDDKWNDSLKKKFMELKEGMKWYVLEYFYDELPGIGIIKEKLKYNSEPIVSVINSKGDIINEDALEIIFQWGIEAFPFRKIDGYDLTKKWSWFWNLMNKVDIHTEDMKKGSYRFIYGGVENNKWIRDFTIAIEKLKKHEHVKDVDVPIEHYQLGRDNPDLVPYFWIGIDGKKQNKKCQDPGVDCEIQEVVRSLLCLKQDPLGWVLLSKGDHIKVLGHGDPMYQTVADFEIWKDKVLVKESFDVAFKEYYDRKVKEISARNPCAYINVDNVLATITCPNPNCGRVMEVTSVNYRCCHRDDPNSCRI
ncbi:protein SIEVE ELEMENT OCCLUSION B-like [Gastrolobium bilobum]|uniref:protein SIEVE ELEMENT OCCLUSION B-like n=1 Tax=Gastrolobium bilobum TaxID=150636 RepID=UPI002AB2F8C7|nr:protein SIEVE ELEMENT OCCLUSION B-like [Gastrolobium bilobum]